jgi:hypothetical protein
VVVAEALDVEVAFSGIHGILGREFNASNFHHDLETFVPKLLLESHWNMVMVLWIRVLSNALRMDRASCTLTLSPLFVGE